MTRQHLARLGLQYCRGAPGIARGVPVHADPPLLGIHIRPLSQPDFRRAQPMPGCYEKNRRIPLGPKPLEPAPEFVLSQQGADARFPTRRRADRWSGFFRFCHIQHKNSIQGEAV